ncbi:DUF948 domain-containing protein [Paenibacillus sp. YN15]|uniref:DUF948 domain-containing protein n=1 Tax=Paenibacillus sp. YN15 TaxID=1742774 RepID=UPI0015ECD3BF|nr:DUF948 domain-containing protein [Paenibacillus sp. YN15]
MIIQISAAVLTIAVVVLIVALVRTLKEARAALNKIGMLTDETRIQLNALSGEVKETIQGVNDVTYDIKTKMAELHSAFQTIGEIGRMAAGTTLTIRQTAASVSRTLRHKLDEQKETAAATQSSLAAWLLTAGKFVQRLNGFRRSKDSKRLTART